MSLSKRADNAKIIKVFEANHGSLKDTATALNITRQTLFMWKEKDPELKEAMQQSLEGLVDEAESSLRLLIKGIPKVSKDGILIGWESKPDVAAVIFFLKCKGKNRGYVEKEFIEIENINLPNIIING